MKTIEEVEAERSDLHEIRDVFTREEFEFFVSINAFIPDDGIGYYHDGNKETDISVWDGSVTPEEAKKYPYVCWYNKQEGK